MENIKYCEYFDVDEKYFPCIDESAIRNGADWTATYPHETFIKLLNATDKMLSGTTKRSVWIHGAYGTGKSQCAYALKKIFEVSPEELRLYWNSFQQLQKDEILLQKILGHKSRGILPVYKYASGSITSPQQLFFEVQNSISTALVEHNISYKGEKSLKESIISWLEDPLHKSFVDGLLKKSEWMSLFAQSTSDEIINTLRKSNDVSSLIDNIFRMASKEGITALNLTADSLRDWILDVIHSNNNLQIVLIWDEFSDFFRQNRNSLGEFQKLVSICQEAPFYFIIVTHPFSSISSNDEAWKIVQQRFDTVEISLPDNIAFELIGHAFNIKSAAKSQWIDLADDLNARLVSSRNAVMKAADIVDSNVMRNILPIHPMAALVLKNIASAFQSNQRSMFDFIKTAKDDKVQAFQWFIRETGPFSDRPLLTIDMLWDFFYTKGHEYLSQDIRLILDIFPQQAQLTNAEQVVLKTVLIMKAIDMRLGGTLKILKPTDRNLKYAFEGDSSEYETSCCSIAKALVNKGILIQTPSSDGQAEYSTAVLAGDNKKIDDLKKRIRDEHNIDRLVQSGGDDLKKSLNLTPALSLRFTPHNDGSLPIITFTNYKKALDSFKHKDFDWRFVAVLALAKTDEEAQSFRTALRQYLLSNEWTNIVVIDALDSPLGLTEFDKYVEHSAMSTYYSGNNKQQSEAEKRKADEVLQRIWKGKISCGQFVVYSSNSKQFEAANGYQNVHAILKEIVLSKFNYVFDFKPGLTETQLKLTQAKQSARYGIGDIDVKGVMSNCDKNLLSKVWGKPDYWKDPILSDEPIVKIKICVEELIQSSFSSSGKIDISTIYDMLMTDYGFSSCNATAFVVGFLLKEYSKDPYRFTDNSGFRDAMSPDRLAEMISLYMTKQSSTSIVSLTDEERAFYDTAEIAWGVNPNIASSPQKVGESIIVKMQDLQYPVWCLKELDSDNVYDVVEMFIDLIQTDNSNKMHELANRIGVVSKQKANLASNMAKLLTKENCYNGMLSFVEQFADGYLMSLAKSIGNVDSLMMRVKELYKIEYSALWREDTGVDQLQTLISEFEMIKYTNDLLNIHVDSVKKIYDKWQEKLKFTPYPCDAIKQQHPTLSTFFECLRKIYNKQQLLPDEIKIFAETMTENFDAINAILNSPIDDFCIIYANYLTGLTDNACEDVMNTISGVFDKTITQSNSEIKTAADNYRKKQLRTQLTNLWYQKTRSKTPLDWSSKARTPILICVDDAEYEKARKHFNTINSQYPIESDVKAALEYISNAAYLEKLDDTAYQDQMFREKLIGVYAPLLKDLDEVRNNLESTGIQAYDWSGNPVVHKTIREMARNIYFAGGSDDALNIIDSMNGDDMKKWIKELVQNNIEIGIEILISKKD